MKLRALWIAGLIVCLPMVAAAQRNTPAGLWKTIDDGTGKVRALVRITEVDGVYSGKIEKLFLEPQEEQHPRCIDCTDDRKGQLVTGMTILTGLKKSPDEDVWQDGKILDPANGEVYRSRATLSADGTKLNVRGFIGFALLGRTQVWIREQ